jgi:hypothetical protein
MMAEMKTSSYGLLAWILVCLVLVLPWHIPSLQADSIDNNLTVSAASYLGGTSDDMTSAVEIAPDKSIIIGGEIAGNDFGTTPITIDGGGDGVVLRLEHTGQNVLSLTRFGGAVHDLDVNRNNGHITAIGPFGVVTLNYTASLALWSQTPGSADTMRIAVAQDGTVAALVGKQVHVYAPVDGAPLGNFTVENSASVNDIAVDSASGLVFITGYRQAAPNLKLPVLRAYTYNGTTTWTGYGFSANAAQAKDDTADSEGRRVAMGRDGWLYFAGKADGGNNVYRRNPQNINQNATNINIDDYTTTSNIGSGSFGYFARLDPATGAHQQGQYVLTRKISDNYRGNSFGINAITADENGQVYLGGGAWFALPCRTPEIVSDSRLCPSRNPLQINGMTAGSYTSNEGAVLAISPDFTSRPLVAVWTGSGTASGSPVQGVAAAYGMRVMVATSNAEGSLITVNPLQGTRAGEGTSKEGFFSLWGDTTMPGTLESVSISGPSTGLTGQDYTFTAEIVAPEGVLLPVSYNWSANGSTPPATTVNTFVYSGTTAGDVTISLTTNDSGSGEASDTHPFKLFEARYQHIPLVLRD